MSNFSAPLQLYAEYLLLGLPRMCSEVFLFSRSVYVVVHTRQTLSITVLFSRLQKCVRLELKTEMVSFPKTMINSLQALTRRYTESEVPLYHSKW